MEENISMGQSPVQSSSPTQPQNHTTSTAPDTPKKKSFVKPLLFILIFLILGFGIYYLIFEMNILETLTGKNLDNDSSNGQEVEETQEEETETLTPFEGEYISTQLPQGWSITEYKDGDGTDMLSEGSEFVGLSGLKIFKDETEVFYMQAVSGLGFAGCPSYAKFSDENPAYYSQILEDNEVSGIEVTLTDYTGTEYEEFTWFGIPFRRIEKTYIYDTQIGNEYFESPCVLSLVSFNEILEAEMDGQTYPTTFDYGAVEQAVEEDLLVVDQILSDMDIVVSE